MDWAKAKTVLIIALIITDIFLLHNYISSNHKTGEIDNQEALIAVLEEGGVSVSEIPSEHKNLPAVTVRYEAPDPAEVDALIKSTSITIKEKDKSEDELIKEYRENASDFIEYLGMKSQYAVPEVIMDKDKNEVRVEFRCEKSGIRLDGSQMTCIFKGGKLKQFDSRWLEPVDISETKLSTVSASVALISFMSEKQSEEPVVIDDIEMVYWVDEDPYSSESAVVEDTALPSWRITLESGQVFHIDAIER